MGFLNHVSKEWTVLKGAPIAFVVLVVFSLCTGFFGGTEFKSQEVKAIQARLDLRNDELDDYKSKLEERLDDVEKKLSEVQVSKIKSALEGKSSSVDIYWNNSSKSAIGYAAEMSKAFEESGWDVIGKHSATLPIGRAVIRTDNTQNSETIGRALDDAGVKYNIGGIATGDGSTDFILE